MFAALVASKPGARSCVHNRDGLKSDREIFRFVVNCGRRRGRNLVWGADMSPKPSPRASPKPREAKTPILGPDVLRKVGEALYGLAWQNELCRVLDVGQRSMQRWAAGKFPIPETIWPELATLCRERGLRLQEIARRLPQGGQEFGGTSGHPLG